MGGGETDGPDDRKRKEKRVSEILSESYTQGKQILEEIQRLRLDKMFPSLATDGMPKGSSQADLSDYAAILDEQIEELKSERLKKAKHYQNIERRIRELQNEDEQEVLRLRYIKGMKWEEVAVCMNFTYRRVTQIHGKALQNFII